MQSLRQLSDELLGVRLRATNVSLWGIEATLTEAARSALNEAVRTYDFKVQRTYYSVILPAAKRTVVVLPKDVDSIIEIYATGNTSGAPRRRLVGYDYRPTTETNLLYIEAKTYPGVRNAEILYESRVTEIPANVAIAATFNTVDRSVQITGGVPAAEWRAPGFFEISSYADTSQREIVRYGAVMPSFFTGLERNVGGVRTMAMNWTVGDIISQVLEIPNEGLPTIFAAASAEMYHYWVRNRALYDQFTAIASHQQLDLGDLLGLIRTEEDRADRRYKKATKGPAPGHVKRKRVRK